MKSFKKNDKLIVVSTHKMFPNRIGYFLFSAGENKSIIIMCTKKSNERNCYEPYCLFSVDIEDVDFYKEKETE